MLPPKEASRNLTQCFLYRTERSDVYPCRPSERQSLLQSYYVVTVICTKHNPILKR